MYKVNAFLQTKITSFIDWFYPPFKKYVPLQIFRYGAAGGANVVLNWILYYLIYHYIFNEEIFYILHTAISPHIASFIAAWPLTFLSGFWLSRYVSFSESEVKGRTQLIRYLLVVLASIVLNYFGLKFFVEICHIFATPSQMITTIITVVFSYFTNKYYSFKS